MKLKDYCQYLIPSPPSSLLTNGHCDNSVVGRVNKSGNGCSVHSRTINAVGTHAELWERNVFTGRDIPLAHMILGRACQSTKTSPTTSLLR